MTADEKQLLRADCLRQLAAITEDAREIESAGIVSHLAGHPRFQSARVIYAFAPLPGEPDWLRAWGADRLWAFPRSEGEHLRFLVVRDPEELIPGRFGVREPTMGSELAPPPDLILVPGVAFDGVGGRLGRGRGYYDRFLAVSSGYRLGVAFRCQVVGRVPVETTDMPMDGLITADGWADAGGGRWIARSGGEHPEVPGRDPAGPPGI